MAQVICAFGARYVIECSADGSAKRIKTSCRCASDEGLDLGEEHLDGIEIGRVGGEEAQFGPARFDCGISSGVFVDVEIIADDNIEGNVGRCQSALN